MSLQAGQEPFQGRQAGVLADVSGNLAIPLPVHGHRVGDVQGYGMVPDLNQQGKSGPIVSGHGTIVS